MYSTVRGTATAWRIAVVVVMVAGPAAAWPAAPAPARTGSPSVRGACGLPLTVTPAMLPAGQRQARVRVGTSLPTLRLAASSGEVGEPRRDGPRTLVADFTAPAADGPALVIVAAVSGDECGFAPIRLPGRADQNAAPGPVTLVVVDRPTIRADRREDVAVYVFALDDAGAPRGGGEPEISASLGDFSTVQAIAPGVWRSSWRIPSGEAGPAAVAAQFGGESPVSAALERTPGPAAELDVDFDRPRGVPGDPAPLSIVVRVRDVVGNLTDGTVEVETDLGEVGAPVRVERGVYQAPLVVPSALRGNRAILVLAKAEGVSATRSLPIAPGEPASVVVTPPGVVSADGSTTAQLEVTITDAFDNPSEDAPEGESRYGEFGPASRLGPGRWVLPYRPRRLLEDTKDTLKVRSGPASTSLDVELKAPRISFNVAPKLGLAVAAGQAGLALGAEASAWTQLGRAQLGLALDGSWWQLSRSSQVTVGGSPAAYQSDQSYVPVLLSVAWRLPIGQRAMLWTSLGGGGAWITSNTQLAGQPAVSESGLAPAASLAVSFGWQLWRGFPFVELRATWVGDPGLATLSGSLTPFFLLAGYRFDAG